MVKLLVLAARKSFVSFLCLLYPPGYSKYILSKLHLFLAKLVQGVADGTESARQAVSVPPQMGKSRMLAVRAVAWMIGYQPGIHIGMTGFSNDLLKLFVEEVNSIIASPLYQLVFPEVKAKFGCDTQREIKFANGSSIIVRPCGSKFAGRRIDWLIIDDPHPGREEAESKTKRKKVIRWYFADCISRMSPDAKIFLIATRWHPDDLIGHLTSETYVRELKVQGEEGEIYNVINLPAIADHDPDAGEACPLGRKPGDAVFPEVRGRKFLLSKKASLPPYEWQSSWCGRPKSSGAGQVDLRKLIPCQLKDVPTDIPWVRGWDLALKEEQKHDFSVGTLGAYDKKTKFFYIIDVSRHKKVWMKMKPKIIKIAMKDKALYNCNKMGLEAVAGFEIGLAELRASLRGEVQVLRKNPPRGGKLMRAQDWFNVIEAKRVYMVIAPWNAELKEEIDEFPDGAHDDRVDSLSVCYECLVRRKKVLHA